MKNLLLLMLIPLTGIAQTPSLRSIDQINLAPKKKSSVDFRSLFNFKEPDNSM